MLRVLSCVLLTGKVKLFLEVEMKSERVLSLEVKMWESEFLEDENIYRYKCVE